jgi:hypothetical protein
MSRAGRDNKDPSGSEYDFDCVGFMLVIHCIP